jgi:type IV secretion system protein TrbE
VLALKPFRSRAAGLPDLLNWAALIDDGIVQGKDGSLLAGWFYRGPDITSSTDDERNWLTGRINAALARLGSGWATWVAAVRLPASGYPPADLSYFPDPVSRLVDEERRRQFMRERLHYESEYALLVQYTPPLRRKSKVADIIYDDDPAERVSPAGRILEQGPCRPRGRDRRGRDAPADAELCRRRRLRSRAPA